MGFLSGGIDPQSGVAEAISRGFMTGFQANENRHAQLDEAKARADEIARTARIAEQKRIQERADKAEDVLRTARTEGERERVKIALMPLESKKAIIQKALEDPDIANKAEYENSLNDINGIMANVGQTFMRNIGEIAVNPTEPTISPYKIPTTHDVPVETNRYTPLSMAPDLRLGGGTITTMQPQGFIPTPQLTTAAKTERALKSAELQGKNLENQKRFLELGTDKVDPVAVREEENRRIKQGEAFQNEINTLGTTIGEYESSYRTYAEKLKNPPPKAAKGGLLSAVGGNAPIAGVSDVPYNPPQADAVSKAYAVRTGYQNIISNIRSGAYDKHLPGASEAISAVDRMYQAGSKDGKYVPVESLQSYQQTMDALGRVSEDPSASENVRKAAGVIRERLYTHYPRITAIRESMDSILK